MTIPAPGSGKGYEVSPVAMFKKKGLLQLMCAMGASLEFFERRADALDRFPPNPGRPLRSPHHLDNGSVCCRGMRLRRMPPRRSQKERSAAQRSVGPLELHPAALTVRALPL